MLNSYNPIFFSRFNHQFDIEWSTKPSQLFCCPIQTYEIWAAAVGAALATAGTAYTLSGAGVPGQPNLGAASAKMENAQVEALPTMDALQAAAEEGKTATIPLTAKQQKEQTSWDKQLASLQSKLATAPTTATKGGGATKSMIQSEIDTLNKKIATIPNTKADFSGFSTADIQGQIMDQLAGGKLATEQEFDPQFIAQSLAEEQQANPQGAAARSQEYADLQQQINNPPKSPVADEMQRQIQEKVNAGSGLTPEEQSMLDTAVNQATSARGGDNVPADFSKALTTGFAGEQRALQNAGEGTQFLASGETPDDIAYRANQQDIADLSQFYSGQTPQSQFKTLSGASTGATPITQSAPLPGVNQNAGATGANAGVSQYEQELSQPNAWLTGLSATLGATNTASAAIG